MYSKFRCGKDYEDSFFITINGTTFICKKCIEADLQEVRRISKKRKQPPQRDSFEEYCSEIKKLNALLTLWFVHFHIAFFFSFSTHKINRKTLIHVTRVFVFFL